MIIMEGFLLFPPDRGSIIGRAAWKPRYVILGRNIDSKTQNNSTSMLAEKCTKSRIGLKSSSSKSDLTDISETGEEGSQLHLAIFKAKGEWEYIANYPVSVFQSCEVRSIQHRKQSPPLPTLIFEFKTDATASKLRKRRSSKTGLIFKDCSSSPLLFRSMDGERHSIYDWVVQMKLLLASPVESGEGRLGSIINFANSFINRSNSSSVRKSESHNKALCHINTSSSHISIGKASDITASSPSLRSRRSDLSSKASSLAQVSGLAGPLGFVSGASSDLSSPASMNGGYDNQLIEGWTSAQGRTSALSSHTRGSNSIASAVTTSTTRETILDRAFQMRCIPGSERVTSAEDTDKLSSTARFEALMRENDERKQARSDNKLRKESLSGKLEEEIHVRDIDEDSEDDLYTNDQEAKLPIPAQRALDFISGRHLPSEKSLSPLTPSSPSPNSTPFLNSQAFYALSGNNELTEESGELLSRPDAIVRINSSRPTTLTIPLRPFSSTTLKKKDNGNSHSCGKADSRHNRRSSTSVKRLSFQEFARRLSSSSSLLLVQPNASSNSTRVSGDYTTELSLTSRSCPSMDEKDQQCAWRGSVGAIGVEGTFL